ncbi:cell division protein DivIC [Dysgonomonas sp. PH5-45]|uniref:FtsB family cell division protein n=1 Tax=unclassified Dysgonomonas TaxID=2630389 RepID=UPI002476E7A0|nr:MULTISPECIES: septum formation initiator family protein [unclassified Dysgonomonas]MDH6353836.1 cell division protein DivIC [Dysgonomonas sp. PH5-45]MDH6386738.1 cell division protein DivIC [Dysgonomonas sp. PH5-37]
MKKIINYITKRFSKVQIAFVVALIIFAFFIGDSNIISRLQYDSEIRDLNKQIEYYRGKKDDDSRKLNELKSNKDNVEKFARENYLMKKPNEDIFVIEDTPKDE